MHKFFESELLKNLTSISAVVVSIIALVFAVLSYSNAKSAVAIQTEAAKRQGDYLQLYAGYVRLYLPGDSHYRSYQRADDGSLTEIPAGDWTKATARGITLRMNNEGQQDAFLGGVYLSYGADFYLDESKLNVKCTNTGAQNWAPCPQVIAAHDGYSVALDIPDDFSSRLSAEERLKGLTVCASSRTGKSACVDLGVVIPAES